MRIWNAQGRTSFFLWHIQTHRNMKSNFHTLNFLHFNCRCLLVIFKFEMNLIVHRTIRNEFLYRAQANQDVPILCTVSDSKVNSKFEWQCHRDWISNNGIRHFYPAIPSVQTNDNDNIRAYSPFSIAVITNTIITNKMASGLVVVVVSSLRMNL